MGFFGKARPQPARTTRPQILSDDESYRRGYDQGRTNMIERGENDTYFYSDLRGYGPSANVPRGAVLVLSRPAVDSSGRDYTELQVSVDGVTSKTWPLPKNVDPAAYARGIKAGIAEHLSAELKGRLAKEEIQRKQAAAASKPWHPL